MLLSLLISMAALSLLYREVVRSKDVVDISNQGFLGISSLSSGSTGNLRIETGTLRVKNTFPQGGVTAITASGSVGSISIQARNAVEVTNGTISTSVRPGSTTQATVGDITIETRRVHLKDGGSISTDTFSSANAANIFIKAGEHVEISGVSSPFNGSISRISSGTRLGATGNGGNVTIETPRLTLTQGGNISATSFMSNGNAGNINIRATDVELDGFSFIPLESLTGLDPSFLQEVFSDPLFSETVSRFGGFYRISEFSSDVIGSNTDVQGGTITIDTERLRLSNGADISTSVILGRGKGGNVIVRATDSIDINGVGPIRLDGSPAPSGLFAELQAGGIGSGGSIDVTTRTLNLSNNGEISAATFNQGDAGNITIKANQINLRGSSNIITQVDDEATGNAGNINITTQLFNVQEESQILSATFGNGNAGNIKVQADNIILTGSDSELSTGISSSVDERANGKGGDIDITTNRLIIRNNAEITSGSSGNGEAGRIGINANFLEINGKGSGIASTTLAGNGGDITLNIRDFLLLRRGGLISTSAGTAEASGNGGNLNISAGFIIASPEENSDITANAFSGAGGRVEINTQGIFGIEPRPGETNFSDITASSTTGINGEIIINTPDADPTRGLVKLPADTVNTAGLVNSSCSAFDGKTGSQFTVTGRGGLPPNPNENLAGDVVWSDTRLTTAAKPQNGAVSQVNRPLKTNETVSIIPATNWVFNNQGEVTLVSHVSQGNADSVGSNQVACHKPV
ncbi:S-layer family protein [Nostoc sp. FACHB-280]|uniref:beta strand repeat-containing protein n=1 Tax=Nostoc sp. FACHB-280 TaxID=2692839 RepID=UPI001F54C462|nr:S-layer family protein [Nostoc sp. FACHB-280]